MKNRWTTLQLATPRRADMCTAVMHVGQLNLSNFLGQSATHLLSLFAEHVHVSISMSLPTVLSQNECLVKLQPTCSAPQTVPVLWSISSTEHSILQCRICTVSFHSFMSMALLGTNITSPIYQLGLFQIPSTRKWLVLIIFFISLLLFLYYYFIILLNYFIIIWFNLTSQWQIKDFSPKLPLNFLIKMTLPHQRIKCLKLKSTFVYVINFICSVFLIFVSMMNVIISALKAGTFTDKNNCCQSATKHLVIPFQSTAWRACCSLSLPLPLFARCSSKW